MQDSNRVQFYREGYTVLPNAIDTKLIEAALRAINQDIGRGVSEQDANKARQSSWCPSLLATPAITNLFNASAVHSLASTLTGKRLKQIVAGQIALRFPGDLCMKGNASEPSPWWNKTWHIDGFHAEQNGIPKGEIRNFSLLVGVPLSDVNDSFCGNLVVYPKSHHVTEQFFRQSGFDEVKEQGLAAFSHLPLCKPVQIAAKAGDVIFAHYNLAHSIAPNCSPHIRYAVYFRVNLRVEGQFHPEPMTNIWLDWPGLKDIVDREYPSKQALLHEAMNGTPIPPMYADEFNQQTNGNRENLVDYKKRMEELWKTADALFDAHKWKEAQQFYDQLIYERPDDFVALLKAACCYTYSPDDQDLMKGELYARKCIQVAPVYPNSYTVLAQNLNRQKRYDEVVPLVNTMLDLPPQDENVTVVDGLKAARDALHALGQLHSLNSLLTLAKERYPSMTEKIDEVC